MYRDTLARVADEFFGKSHMLKIIGPSSGYSESQLAQVTDCNGQEWCVRLWINEPVDRLRLIHQTLQHSRRNGCTFIPQLAKDCTDNTLVRCDNGWGEAQSWVEGAPLTTNQPPTERVPNRGHHVTTEERRQIVTALTTFHASVEDLQPPPTVTVPLPKQLLELTLQQIEAELVGLGTESLLDRRVWSADDRTIVDGWLTAVPSLLTALHRHGLQLGGFRLADVAACHCDLWSDHVYFIGETLSGFVDFGAVTYTTKAIDLAQLILHFGGWQTAAEVLSVYLARMPLSDDSQRLLPLLAACDLLSEGIWAMQELRNNELPVIEQTAHWHNLRFFLPSLEQLTDELIK